MAEALHAVRSLVCLSTNETPHERLFRFPRRSINGTALSSWLLTPGTVLLRRHVGNEVDLLCDPVELVKGNTRESHVFGCAFTGWQRKHCLYCRSGSVPSCSQRQEEPTDRVAGKDMGDVAADEADGIRGEREIDESSFAGDVFSDSAPTLTHRSPRRHKPPDGCRLNAVSI